MFHSMFITLLVATFAVAFLVSSIVALLFKKPISGILERLIQEDIYRSWERYLYFAIYVVGISCGVRVWSLEKYINPPVCGNGRVLALNFDTWALEIYRTIIETLQGDAWLLFVFFIVALIAYVIVKVKEMVTARRPLTEGK